MNWLDLLFYLVVLLVAFDAWNQARQARREVAELRRQHTDDEAGSYHYDPLGPPPERLRRRE